MKESIEPTNEVTIGGEYLMPRNFVFEEDSPLQKLTQALCALSGRVTDNGLNMVDGWGTDLDSAHYYASEISKTFNGVNNSISASWNNVGEFAHTIDAKVRSLTQNFTDELRNFITNTQQHEQEIQEATTTANELAKDILAQLGL